MVSPKGSGQTQGLKFRLEAGPDNPVVNPAFVVENWGHRGAAVRMNGRDVRQTKDFRIGFIRRINRYDLVVWMPLESRSPVSIELGPSSIRD